MPYIFIAIVITVVPLAPACMYFLAGQKDMTPLRRALQVPQLLFLSAFLVTGVVAVRYLADQALQEPARALYLQGAPRVKLALSNDARSDNLCARERRNSFSGRCCSCGKSTSTRSCSRHSWYSLLQ